MMKRRYVWALCLAMISMLGCERDVGPRGNYTEAEDVGEDAEIYDASVDSGAEEDIAEEDTAVDADAGPTEYASPFDESNPLGGEREARLFLPDSYDTSEQWPLVIMLHGYGADSWSQSVYFGLEDAATEHGFIALAPDGIRDTVTSRFWSATEACCDHYGDGVDDVAYLTDLLDEAEERLAVDTSRVYFLGHSNGGFMSYQMACELGSRITALASLAGTSHLDAEDCADPGNTAVLQIHGTLDAVILYGGGMLNTDFYPGAEEVVERWAAHHGCEEEPTSLDDFDVDLNVFGDETEVERYNDCEGETSVELWRIQAGSHLPTLSSHFMSGLMEFFYRHEGSL